MIVTLPLGYLAPYSPDDGFDGDVRAWLRHLLERYPGKKAEIRQVYEGWRDHGMAATSRRLGRQAAERVEELVIQAINSEGNAVAEEDEIKTLRDIDNSYDLYELKDKCRELLKENAALRESLDFARDTLETVIGDDEAKAAGVFQGPLIPRVLEKIDRTLRGSP